MMMKVTRQTSVKIRSKVRNSSLGAKIESLVHRCVYKTGKQQPTISSGSMWYAVTFVSKLKFSWASTKAITLFENKALWDCD